jgi:hypothetical protein
MVIGGQLETDRPEWANQISDRVEHFFPAYDRVELGETTAVARARVPRTGSFCWSGL